MVRKQVRKCVEWTYLSYDTQLEPKCLISKRNLAIEKYSVWRAQRPEII